MTQKQFEKQLASYQTSTAPDDVKAEAIKKLEQQYYGAIRTNVTALKQIEEQQADYSDIGKD